LTGITLVSLGFSWFFWTWYNMDVPAAANAYNQSLREQLHVTELAAAKRAVPHINALPTSSGSQSTSPGSAPATTTVSQDLADQSNACSIAAKSWTTAQLETRVASELLLEGISLTRLEMQLEVARSPQGCWMIQLVSADKSPWVRTIAELDDNLDAAAAQVTTVVSGMLQSSQPTTAPRDE
jgi:hypothetical protein